MPAAWLRAGSHRGIFTERILYIFSQTAGERQSQIRPCWVLSLGRTRTSARCGGAAPRHPTAQTYQGRKSQSRVGRGASVGARVGASRKIDNRAGRPAVRVPCRRRAHRRWRWTMQRPLPLAATSKIGHRAPRDPALQPRRDLALARHAAGTLARHAAGTLEVGRSGAGRTRSGAAPILSGPALPVAEAALARRAAAILAVAAVATAAATHRARARGKAPPGRVASRTGTPISAPMSSSIFSTTTKRRSSPTGDLWRRGRVVPHCCARPTMPQAGAGAWQASQADGEACPRRRRSSSFSSSSRSRG